MVILEDITGPELRRRIQRGLKTAVSPVGSIEHHEGHLPLGTDAVLADLAGQAVADRLDAALAPTIRVGYTHGFRVVALISAHGGTSPRSIEPHASSGSRAAI